MLLASRCAFVHEVLFWDSIKIVSFASCKINNRSSNTVRSLGTVTTKEKHKHKRNFVRKYCSWPSLREQSASQKGDKNWNKTSFEPERIR